MEKARHHPSTLLKVIAVEKRCAELENEGRKNHDSEAQWLVTILEEEKPRLLSPSSRLINVISSLMLHTVIG